MIDTKITQQQKQFKILLLGDDGIQKHQFRYLNTITKNVDQVL